MPHKSDFLNEKQLTVLRWVDVGAPAEAYPPGNYAHRITARGLANRGLIRIDGQGADWRASLTPAGKRRLELAEEDPEQQRPSTASADLFARVIAAGGSLQVNEGDSNDYKSLVDNSLTSPSRPRGLRLRVRTDGPFYRSRVVEVYLDEHIRDLVEAAPVPLSVRLKNPHPAAQAFRADTDGNFVSKASIERAARVYDSIAKEAERRGYEALDEQSFLSRNSGTRGSGYLVLVAHGLFFPIGVREIAGVGGAKLSYPYKRSLPSWVQRRGYEFVPTGKLELQISGPGTPYPAQKLRETQRRGIEELLPEVFLTVEVSARESKKRDKERHEALLARQAQWEVAMENAKERHRDEQIAITIAAKAAEWKKDQDLAAFLAALEARIPEMDGEARQAAQIWLTRGRQNMQGSALLDSLGPLYYERPKMGELNQYLSGFTETRPA